MKLYTLGNQIIRAKVAKKPSFTEHKGRIWKIIDKEIDGIDTDFMYDTRFGKNFYFSFKDKFYKIKIKLKQGMTTIDTTKIKKLSTKPHFLSVRGIKR